MSRTRRSFTTEYKVEAAPPKTSFPVWCWATTRLRCGTKRNWSTTEAATRSTSANINIARMPLQLHK